MEPQHRSLTTSRRRGLALVVLGLLLACSGAAWGHAHPEQMAPAHDAVLQQPPSQVVIRFSEALEPAFSSIEVTDADGNVVNQGNSHVDDSQPKVIVAPLQSLQPGSYQVQWHVVSRDGHTTDGAYSFTLQ